MRENGKRKRIRKASDIAQISAILGLFILTIALDIVCKRRAHTLRCVLLFQLAQQLCGALASILLMARIGVRLFGKPRGLVYMIPCLMIAVDNFQFGAYFQGEMQLVYNSPTDILLFAGYCLSVGLFEEFIFRGIVFSVLVGLLPKTRKGFLLAYALNSLTFGVMHIFNGFSVGVLLQVGYSVLTGGLFAFCLIKTKNILCSAIVHGLYNFCGLLFGEFNPSKGSIGLGAGVVFNEITVITMLIVSVLVGIFVLYKVITYSEEERLDLYEKLGVTGEKKAENNKEG